MPHGSVCGHSGCDDMCKVRYAGPTSHPRDHRMHEIASGVKHVWTASVVAGLAVVLTGVIAFNAVQAETAPKVKNLNEAVAAIWRKLDVIDANVKSIKAKMENGQGMPRPTSSTQPMMNNQQGGQKPEGQKPSGDRPQLSEEAKACISACQSTWKTCQSAASDSSAKEACTKTALTCLSACVPSGAPVPPLGGEPKPQGTQGQEPTAAPQVQ
jgi:hypothetical protein